MQTMKNKVKGLGSDKLVESWVVLELDWWFQLLMVFLTKRMSDNALDITFEALGRCILNTVQT
jgi:hypothetical protein